MSRVTFSSAHRIPLSSEFFMGRRPVLDRQQQLAAHDLVFCSTASGSEREAEHHPTGASILEDVRRDGLLRLTGGVPAYLHVDSEALHAEHLHLLPHDGVILTLAERSHATPSLLERLAAWKERGYRIALDVVADQPDRHLLLPLADIARIDIGDPAAPALARACREAGKLLLAEHVDSEQEHLLWRELGFDYCQGTFFTRPYAGGKSFSPSQAAVSELLAMLAADTDDAAIEARFKGDLPLCLRLLRLSGSSVAGGRRIESLRQALMILGRNQLRQWLQIMLAADRFSSEAEVVPLAVLALSRARLMELIAHHAMPTNQGQADAAFTIGILSLMPALAQQPMEDLLRDIPLEEELQDALLRREGYFGALLDLVERTEWQHRAGLPAAGTLQRFRLTCADLYMLQVAAFEWSNGLTARMR